MRERDDAELEPGDQQASHEQLAGMYRARAGMLRRYLRGRFRGSDEGEDLVQDTFLRLASQGSLARIKNPDAYLKRTLRNLLIDRARRAKARPTLVGMEGNEPSVRADQADGLEYAEMRVRYRAIVEQLPPRTREVFLLHRVEDCSVKDIAARLEISTRTVEWHVAQAILRIGAALDRS
jgi:RNA polymerase sigma factor (sigma-70 family)